jgi:hypothetical protein
MRCQRFGGATRRRRENILYGSLLTCNPAASAKIGNPTGAKLRRAAGGVAPQSHIRFIWATDVEAAVLGRNLDLYLPV